MMMTSLPAPSIRTMPTRTYLIAAQYADSLAPFRQQLDDETLRIGVNTPNSQIDAGELSLASQVLGDYIQYYGAMGYGSHPTVQGWQSILDATNVMSNNFTTFTGNGMPTIIDENNPASVPSFTYQDIIDVAGQTNDGFAWVGNNATLLSQQDLNSIVVPM
jgi:hypothetical protein